MTAVYVQDSEPEFVCYTTAGLIRYVVVPRAETDAAISKPQIQVETADLYSDDVLQSLQQHTRRIPAAP
jgi:hypothetical protein